MSHAVCRCGKPTRDNRYVCDQCAAKLERALANVAFLAEELDTHIARQKAAALNGGAASAEKGLPWHEKAGEARRDLHALLVSWVKFATEEHVRGAPDYQPADTLPSLAAWLLHVVDGLTLHDIGPEAADEITDAVAGCRRVVFYKRKHRVYLGMCGIPLEDEDGELVGEDCPGEVYADPDADVGYCDDCKRGHTVVIRRGELEKRLDDRLCTPAEIARLSTYLGLHVDRDMVRKRVHYWHQHKRITASSRADNGDPMFRYGEVRSMLYQEFASQLARGA